MAVVLLTKANEFFVVRSIGSCLVKGSGSSVSFLSVPGVLVIWRVKRLAEHWIKLVVGGTVTVLFFLFGTRCSQ